MFKSSVTKQTLIKQQLFKILKKEDGKNVKKMNNGMFIGLSLGLSKTFLILIMVIEWVKCSKYFSTLNFKYSNILLKHFIEY
jgi:hypothetical protein